MSDPARELLRDAQAAEVRGDKAQATLLLLRAAELYERRGQSSRASQMLRHVLRISPGHEESLARLARIESLDVPESLHDDEDLLRRAVIHEIGEATHFDPDRDESLSKRRTKFAPEEGAPEGPGPSRPAPRREERTLRAVPEPSEAETPFEGGLSAQFERELKLAEPGGAWCSFCCRPDQEVGAVVAGPTNVFICQTCALEALALIDSDFELEPPPQARRSRSAERPPTSRSLPAFVGQLHAQKVLELAMRVDARVVLLLGPEGSGKSAFLERLEAEGHGRYMGDAKLPNLQRGDRLLWDNIEHLSGPQREDLLARLWSVPDARVLVALRGDVPPRAVTLESDEVSLDVHSTQALLEATYGVLPESLAEAVQVVAHFRALSKPELRELAVVLLSRRDPRPEVDDATLEVLAQQAKLSGRGARELEALIDRLPAGTWTLTRTARPAAPRPVKKAKPTSKAKASKARAVAVAPTPAARKKKGTAKKGKGTRAPPGKPKGKKR